MADTAERRGFAESIASTMADYRRDQIAEPSPEHVMRWVRQFDPAVRTPILAELDHVLNRVYVPRRTAKTFLRNLIRNPQLAGTDPESFWRTAGLLRIQQGGNSQADLVEIFGSALQHEIGLSLDACAAAADGPFIYIDDGIFSGNRVRHDLEAWIAGPAPQRATVHVIAMAVHTGGRYYAQQRINAAANNSGKVITFHWWQAIELEDRRTSINQSDVLRPRSIPDHTDVQAYAQALADAGHPVVLRTVDSRGSCELFSSEEARNLLEQEFLKKGAEIRGMCPLLPASARPLGYHVLRTLGFGSLLVTWRNCPNNAPLVLWVGPPWYPLFERITN